VSAARREALRARLRQADLDALLVTKLVNVRYLSGFTGSAGSLLVTQDGRGDVLVVDGRYTEQAATQAADLDRIESRLREWLVPRLAGRTRLGVESAHLSWDAARALISELGPVKVMPATGHVEALRAVKDPDEVALLAAACGIGDEVFTRLCTWLTPGLREIDVSRWLEREIIVAGADAVAFPPIVAGGPNGARPHHAPGERHLVQGDLVTLDFGAQVGGYSSDMTRTVALGEPSQRLRSLHDLVLSAERDGIQSVAQGVTTGQVDAACRERIATGGLRERFVHSTGHGVGLEIHEEPSVREGAEAKLLAGMVITIEPGVYVPGLGGVRIEDTVVVTSGTSAGTAAVLTRSPTDLLSL
jgi:Xaa-Pro aminopeptidase